MACKHRCYISDIKRIDENRVECICHLCGKNLSAAYGLAIDATLEQRP